MAKLPIHIWPDPVLSTRADEVKVFDDALRTMVGDMFETMADARGIGLAANQVGILQRVLIVDLDPENDAAGDPELAEQLKEWGYEKPMVLINAEITSSHGKITWEEGCLSVPGVTEKVDRAESVTVKACDEFGKPFTLEAHGLFAVCIQHELDHLNGRVFVEYLSKLKRDLIKRRMIKAKAEHTVNETQTVSI